MYRGRAKSKLSHGLSLCWGALTSMANAGPDGALTLSVTTVSASSVLTLTTAYGRSVLKNVVVGCTGVTSPCPKRLLDWIPFASTTLASWFAGRGGAGV